MLLLTLDFKIRANRASMKVSPSLSYNFLKYCSAYSDPSALIILCRHIRIWFSYGVSTHSDGCCKYAGKLLYALKVRVLLSVESGYIALFLFGSNYKYFIL